MRVRERVTIFLIAVNLGLIVADGIRKNSVNATEEIRELFSGKNVSKQTERSSSTGLDPSQYHFAEGSSHNEDKKQDVNIPISTKPQVDGREHGPITNHQNISQIIPNVNINNGAKINDTFLPSLKNDSSLKKLDDMDLALGIPQVDHINNTSTIKARKGAIPIDVLPDETSSKPIPSKIVPRKGVPSDNSLPICFKTNNNTCFNVTKYQESDCSCCNSSSKSEEVISTDSVNCSSCKPINNILVDGSLSCVKVCCKNKTLDSNKLINNKNNSGLEIVNVTTKNETVSHKKKHKPTFTQTPIDGDAENITISTFQSKKAVVIPIIVSVLILPLISILAFFIYKRTRDYWDKRYYKRMDFLIDGMYND